MVIAQKTNDLMWKMDQILNNILGTKYPNDASVYNDRLRSTLTDAFGFNLNMFDTHQFAFSGYNGSYGNLIIVDCGNGVQIYYGHCSKLLASVGDKVEAGDIIAQVGSTGNSTGNHLHFEIKVNGVSVNPQNYIYN